MINLHIRQKTYETSGFCRSVESLSHSLDFTRRRLVAGHRRFRAIYLTFSYLYQRTTDCSEISVRTTNLRGPASQSTEGFGNKCTKHNPNDFNIITSFKKLYLSWYHNAAKMEIVRCATSGVMWSPATKKTWLWHRNPLHRCLGVKPSSLIQTDGIRG
jgi:hypothetical protein